MTKSRKIFCRERLHTNTTSIPRFEILDDILVSHPERTILRVLRIFEGFLLILDFFEGFEQFSNKFEEILRILEYFLKENCEGFFRPRSGRFFFDTSPENVGLLLYSDVWG